MHWLVIATPLGTIVGRSIELPSIIKLNPSRVDFELFDACIVTQVPELLYVRLSDLGKPLASVPTWSYSDAFNLQFAIHGEELVETESEKMVDSYIPIKPSQSPMDSIHIMTSSIIFWYEMDYETSRKMEDHINFLNNRLKAKPINEEQTKGQCS